VLFEDALRTLCKINRIITAPFGHILNIGLGGSGSRTLTRLAVFMQDYVLYEIEMEKDFGVNEWLDFIRDMLRDIVLKNRSAVFLISDA
jgi:dynein heavy chain